MIGEFAATYQTMSEAPVVWLPMMRIGAPFWKTPIAAEVPTTKKDASDLKAQESPFLKRQDVLVKDEHSGHDHGSAPKVRVVGPSALEDFKKDGRMSVTWSRKRCRQSWILGRWPHGPRMRPR